MIYSDFCDILKEKKNWLLILLFSVSVSVTVLPCSIVNTLGLFGEITSTTVTDDKEAEIVEVNRIHDNIDQVKKGITIYNIWFEVWICIICLIFAVYILRLPGVDTIVSLKVRMDN